MQPSTQHLTPALNSSSPWRAAGYRGGVRLSPHPLPCIQARQICFLLHDHLCSHLAIKDVLVTLLTTVGEGPPRLFISASMRHPQHRSSMGSLHPRLLAGCSSWQLAAGSLSHSTASFCAEKHRAQTLLQPRRVFLLPSMCPGGHSCTGCDPASNHTSPLAQGSQVLAPQVPPHPRL